MMSAGPPPQQMSAALAMQRQQQAEQAQAQALYNARLQVGAPGTLSRGAWHPKNIMLCGCLRLCCPHARDAACCLVLHATLYI